MGSGKTSYFRREVLPNEQAKNFLYVTPRLNDIEEFISKTRRDFVQPENKGAGKLSNIVDLLNDQRDIAATHELFRRFDDRCKQALSDNHYTLILDEALSAVEQYKTKADNFIHLLESKDIKIEPDGMIKWIGRTDLDFDFNDIRTLSLNECLFVVDGKFYVWHFPHDIFSLFDKVYVLTYNFKGSLLKYYFDLYEIIYDYKSICEVDGRYQLTEYAPADLTIPRNRIKLYDRKDLNENIGQKENLLSATWCSRAHNRPKLVQLQKNLVTYQSNRAKAKSCDTLWTTYKETRKHLRHKGYANSFLPCNTKSTNEYQDRHALMYCVNWYTHPEIKKFFDMRGTTIDQDQIALNEMIQWIWRSNIRVNDSSDSINLYIPSPRMRRIFTEWLY